MSAVAPLILSKATALDLDDIDWSLDLSHLQVKEEPSFEDRLDNLVIHLTGDEDDDECSQRYKEYILAKHRQDMKTYRRKKRSEAGKSSACKIRGPRRIFHPKILRCSAYLANRARRSRARAIKFL